MSVASFIDKKTAKLEEEIKEIRARRQKRREEQAETEARVAKAKARVVEWETWYERWLEAGARGETFEEPPPPFDFFADD